MATEGDILDGVSATPNAGLEERYLMKDHLSSMESSSPAKSPTENICKSEHHQVDKIENEALTKISENEVEAINNDINIEEPDHHIENDGAEDSKLTCVKEPITVQHASSEVITRTKGEEDADLESNGQATIISETNTARINEASPAENALTSKSQGEEDERVVESCAKEEHIDTAIHVENESKEMGLAGEQNKKEEMPSVLRGRLKDPKSIGSSDKLEHEDIREEDASTVNVEESSFEAASKNGDNEDVTDEASVEVEIEAGETLQEAFNTACKDKNKDETEMDKAEDSACLNRDKTEANEKDIIQTRLTESNEDSKINPGKHNEEKGDLQQKNEQEEELGEQAVLIQEKTETAAPGENAKEGVEQNLHPDPVEKLEEKEEKDEPTSAPDTMETSISTEKSLPIAESISKIKREESIFPEKVTDDLKSEDPLVKEKEQPDSGETGEVSTTEAQEKHQESSKFCTENSEQDEHCSETQRTENLVIKHIDSEAMVTTETITQSTKDTEELEKFPESHSDERSDIKGDEKIIPYELEEMEEATDLQFYETANESVSEDEAPSGLSTMTPVRDETIKQSIEEESLKDGEPTLIQNSESHGPENNAEENKIADEAFDLPKTTGESDIYKQQVTEGSVEETLITFEDNEKEVQKLREDTDREIKGENYVRDPPLEFIQNTEVEEIYSMTAHLDSNPRECSPAESKSSVESTENICKSEHLQADDIENQDLSQVSDMERQHQSKDVETGGDKVEATNDKNTEEPDRDKENDGAKISRLASAEEPNLKVPEENNSMDDSSLDQHLETVTNQHASELISESMEKEMITTETNENTKSKGEKDADSECNEHATSISETNLGLLNEASLPNLDLATKSQGEENEREIESCIKDEDIETTPYVEDEFREVNLTAEQNKKVVMPSIMEGEEKDPESIKSSDKLEHENKREDAASTVIVVQSPYDHRVEESTCKDASENEETDNDKSENPSFNLVTNGMSTEVAVEAPVDGMAKAEDSACLNRDVRGAKEDEIIQMEVAETNEDGRINSEIHNGEKGDLCQRNDQDDEPGEKAIQIPEKNEIAALRENAENIVEENKHPVEKFEEKKDEPTSTSDSGETSVSIEKSLPLAETITKIESEETIFSEKIANDLNSEDPLVQEAGQPDSGERGEVSKIEAEEKHQESSQLCTETNKQDEHHYETQSTDNLDIKHMDSEAMATTETITKSTKDTEELDEVPESYSVEKIDIKGDEKILPEEPEETEEVTDKQLDEAAKEGVIEDEAPSGLQTTGIIRDEKIEESIAEESLKDGEPTFTEKNDSHIPENDAEEKKEAVQNTGLEEEYSTEAQLDNNPKECSLVECESSVESSSSDKSLTENVSQSDHHQADKIQNQAVTEISENEKQHQEGVSGNDVETGGDKVETINDISIEEPDHEIENDGAKISMLTNTEEPHLKVHEDETFTSNSSLEQHLELITDQQASVEVIPESTERDEKTKSKGEEDVDLESNEQASMSETNLGLINEASPPNLDLSIKSQREEDEREIESHIKDEDTETTIHVEDEFKEPSMTGVQNKKAEMSSILKVASKDPKSIGSSDKLEHENTREEDTSTVNVVQSPLVHSAEEFTLEAASKDGDSDNSRNETENSSSNLLTDGASTQVAIEAGETLEEASCTACKDVPPVDGMDKVDDSACLNRDVRGANEEDIIQTGLEETNEEKIDSRQEKDQEGELGEQVILIPEKTEIEAPRENVEKRDEQNIHPVEKIEEKEEKDEPTPIPDSGETSTSTEKKLPRAQSITQITSEETKEPSVEETEELDNGEIGKVPKTEAQEKHEESTEFCTENNNQDETETQSAENLIIEHMDTEATTTTMTKSTKDNGELKKVPESQSEEKIDIRGDEVIPKEPKETEETNDKQLHETAEGASEDKAPSRLPTTASIKDKPDESVELTVQEESSEVGESTLIERNERHRSENDAEENEKSVEDFDLPKATGGQDTCKQQITEESVEETTDNFQDDENKIQNLSNDAGKEIKGESYAPDLHPEFIQNTRVVETYSTTVQLDSNPNECSEAESKSSMESSPHDQSPLETICKSEHFQPDQIENQAFTKVSEDERQHQEGVLSKDDDTGGNKVEAINDIEEPDHDIENDSAKISRPALVEEPNPKAHEEETSMDNSSLDQQFELITDQHASSKVIVEGMENEMITSQTKESTGTKGEEDADLECHEQATSIPLTSFGLINEASLSNPDLTIKSQGEEDERVVSDLDSEDPLVQGTGQPDSDETGEVSKIEAAEEKHQESSKFCTQTNKQDEYHSETQSTDNMIIKHTNSEAMVIRETITKSTNEELEKAPKSHSEENIDIKGDEKVISEEPNEREEAIDKQSLTTAKESVSEDEAPSELPTTEAIRDERLGLSFQNEGLKDGESTLIEKNESHMPENDAEEDEKAVEDKADCNDTDREIKGENYIPNLPPEFIQTFNELQHGTADDTILFESNQNLENPEKVSDMLPNKQEKSLLGEHDNPTPKEALTEDQDEYAYSNVDDDNGEKSGVANQKEKLEVPDMIPVGSKAKASGEDSESTTCTEGEETTARVDKIYQKEEMKEEPKDVDGTEENKASNQEVPVTTSSSQATIENILKECEPSETEASVSRPEEETENIIETLSSATVGTNTGKKYLEEDEREETKMREEVEVTESEGQIEATYLIEEKASSILVDCAEPKDNCALSIEENDNNLVKGPSSIPGVLEKDSSSTNDSETEFLRVVDENTAIKDVQPVDIAERQEEETNSEENRDMEVGEVADQGEKISQDIKDKDLISGINCEKELTITDHQLVHTILDSSMVPSNGEPSTTEMSKMTENTPARGDILYVETETPLITPAEGALLGSSDNEKEYSNEGIQKHKDGDQVMSLDLKTETNISESDTEDREKGKREVVNDLTDQSGACKLEIEDEKSTIGVIKGLLQEEELADKTQDSSAVIEAEREAASLGSQEESVDAKTSDLEMKKGDFVAKDQSEETLLHSSNNQAEEKVNNVQDQDTQFVQKVIRLQVEGDIETNKKPKCNDEELLNLSLDQDEDTKDKLTQEVHQRLGTDDTTEGRKTSPAKETGNQVEVSTSEFTEKIESIKSTEEKECVTLEDHTEHNMDSTDFSALKSTDASETCTEVSSSMPKVYEKENEAGSIKKDEPVVDEPKNEPVIVEIEETGLKNAGPGHVEYDFEVEETGLRNAGPGHVEYDKGSDTEIENKDETAITTDNIKSDSIDITEREAENFDPEKKGILEESNEGMDSCVKETDKTTTVQHEKELTTSSIPISQDNPALLVEEKGNATIYPMDGRSISEEITDEIAEAYLVQSEENKSFQKEDVVVIPGGVSESEPVDITNECSNDDSPKLENEEKEEKLSVDASTCTASSTYKDGEVTKGQQDLDTTFEGSFTNVAVEKAAIALETKDVSHENEPTDEFPSEKTVEADDMNKKVELASEPMVEDQRDEKIYQAEEENNLEDHISESREKVPGQKFQGERELDMQFEVEHHRDVHEASVAGGCTENVLEETEKANGSGNILQHIPEPNSNQKEPDNLSAGYETVNEVTATTSQFTEQTEKMDLVEERECRTLENLAKATEDFNSPTTIEASVEGIHQEVQKDSEVEIFNKKDDTDTFKTLPCMPERKDVTTTDKVKTCLDTVDTGNIQEEGSNSEDSRDKQSPEVVGEGGREIDEDARDKAPTTGDKHEKDEDTSLTLMPNDSLQNPSVIQTAEEEMLKNKFSNSIDNQASDDQAYTNAETTLVVHTAGEKLPQSDHDVIKPEVSSELETAVVENENANKDIQRQEDDDLHDLNSQSAISDAEDIKMSRIEKGSGVTDQNGAGTLEEVKDQKPCIDINGTNDEQDADNFRTSSSIIVAEKIATESDPGGDSTKTEQSELPAEKILEPDNLDKNLESASESKFHHQTDEQLPQTKEKRNHNNQDCISEIIEQSPGIEHESEKQKKLEPQTEAEEVHDGVDRAAGAKNIDEQSIHYIVSSMEFQTLSGTDETVNQVKETDSSKHTAIVDLGVEDHRMRKESSSAIEALEEDMQDKGNRRSIDDLAGGPQVLEGKIEKKIKAEGNNCINMTETMPVEVQKVESSTREAQLDDKPVEGSNLNKQCPETVQIMPSLEAEEVRGMEVEKNSSLFAQLPQAANENVGRETQFPENPDGRLSKDFKITSPLVESKDEYVEDIDASEQNTSSDQNEEDTKGSSDMISRHNRADVEAFSKDRTLDDQILLSQNSEEKLQTQSSSGTKIYEESQKDSSNEVREKGRTPDIVVHLESHENEEKEYINALSESEQIKEATESKEATKLQQEENQSEITATDKTINTVVSNEKVKEEQEAPKDFQQIYAGERDRISDQETEQSAIAIEKTDTTIQTINNDNQHEVKSEANEKGEHENTTDNLPDDTEGKHVTEATTTLTHEVQKDQEEHMDPAEACEHTRETQKQEETSLATVDIKVGVKADAESRKTEEDFLEVPRNPDRETMPEAKPINEEVEGTQVGEENISLSEILQRSTEEPLQAVKTPKAETPQCEEAKEESEKVEEGRGDEIENAKINPTSLSGDSVMVDASRDRNVKVAHKKSHSILSGVGSKVKHSISKVKKAITGKSSHPKTPSPK